MPAKIPNRRPLHLIAILFVALLIAANLTLIFSFSSENREESGSRSREVTLIVARICYADFDDLPATEQEAIVDTLHGFVRKTAHFLEFALLGCLTASLVCLVWSFVGWRARVWQTAGIPALFCLLTAISDEVYQIFTGRGPAVKDVLIDFCGAVSGVIFLHLAVWLVGRIHSARQRKIQKKEARAA